MLNLHGNEEHIKKAFLENEIVRNNIVTIF